MITQSPLLKRFTDFVIERHNIYLRRAAGHPKPWTTDPVLQQYRFCNVYRELDTVTQWLRTNWREPHSANPNLWFAMVVARLINRPDALKESGYPVPWHPERWVRVLDARKQRGDRVFSGAYMIRGVESNGRSKVQYLAEDVLTPMWAKRKEFPVHSTLARAHEWLMDQYGLGSFLAAQVVADVKYTPLLYNAPDWATWAAPGPGSQRGLNRVMGLDVKSPWAAEEWLTKVQDLRLGLNKALPKGWGPLHTQDVQNCLCEFDKYRRTQLSEGRPKQLYSGGA
jgi:hypothetical protein